MIRSTSKTKICSFLQLILLIMVLFTFTSCSKRQDSNQSSEDEDISENLTREDQVTEQNTMIPQHTPTALEWVKDRLTYEPLSIITDSLNGKTWEKIHLKGELIPIENETVLRGRGEIWVYIPHYQAEDLPLIIGLPGWNDDAIKWETRCRISDYADQNQMAVVLINMGKSVYESQFYNSTKSEARWCGFECTIPGSVWVAEVILPYLQENYPVSHNKQRTAIFGLSTGGQGAVLIAQKYPFFNAAVAMSGTFNNMSLAVEGGEYRIHENIYGRRDVHPERWEKDDSILLVDQLKEVAVMLIHGGQDNAVPYVQSEELAQTMQEKNFKVQLIIDYDFGHQWELWEKYLPTGIDFIMENIE